MILSMHPSSICRCQRLQYDMKKLLYSDLALASKCKFAGVIHPVTDTLRQPLSSLCNVLLILIDLYCFLAHRRSPKKPNHASGSGEVESLASCIRDMKLEAWSLWHMPNRALEVQTTTVVDASSVPA